MIFPLLHRLSNTFSLSPRSTYRLETGIVVNIHNLSATLINSQRDISTQEQIMFRDCEMCGRALLCNAFINISTYRSGNECAITEIGKGNKEKGGSLPVYSILLGERWRSVENVISSDLMVQWDENIHVIARRHNIKRGRQFLGDHQSERPEMRKESIYIEIRKSVHMFHWNNKNYLVAVNYAVRNFELIEFLVIFISMFVLIVWKRTEIVRHNKWIFLELQKK